MATQIKVILSDLDGVIRHYPDYHSVEIENEFEIPSGKLLPVAFQKKLLEPVVTGQISDEEWRRLTAIELSQLIPLEQAKKAVQKWSAFPGKLDENVMNLLVSYKTQSQLMLLTNGTNKLVPDLITHNILNHFDQIFNASSIGFAKPDMKCFIHVIDKIGLEPSEILFIDDRSENVEAAQGLGMQGHHFKSYVDLKSFLNSKYSRGRSENGPS